MASSSSVRMIRNLLRWCRISRDGDDAGDFPIQQVDYQGKVGDAVVWFPYGLHANIPTGELAVMLGIGGNAEGRVVMPGSPNQRPKVAAGEVVIYHPPSGSKVHFRANGDIEITSTSKVKIDAPSAELTGDVTVAGDLTVTGDAILGTTVTSGGKDISDTHTHTAGTYLDSTPAPVTGVSGPVV